MTKFHLCEKFWRGEIRTHKSREDIIEPVSDNIPNLMTESSEGGLQAKAVGNVCKGTP